MLTIACAAAFCSVANDIESPHDARPEFTSNLAYPETRHPGETRFAPHVGNDIGFAAGCSGALFASVSAPSGGIGARGHWPECRLRRPARLSRLLLYLLHGAGTALDLLGRAVC